VLAKHGQENLVGLSGHLLVVHRLAPRSFPVSWFRFPLPSSPIVIHSSTGGNT